MQIIRLTMRNKESSIIKITLKLLSLSLVIFPNLAEKNLCIEILSTWSQLLLYITSIQPYCDYNDFVFSYSINANLSNSLLLIQVALSS